MATSLATTTPFSGGSATEVFRPTYKGVKFFGKEPSVMDYCRLLRYSSSMTRGLGYSNTPFNPSRPGRLCRGREAWSKSWEEEGVVELHRFVVSGAKFSDDSARDATRGLNVVGVDAGDLLSSMFPKSEMVAFKEDGELALRPDSVEDYEEYWATHCGGRRMDPSVRWRTLVKESADIGRLVADGAVDGFLVGSKWPLSAEAEEALFLLTNFADDTKFPIERFQPMAFEAVLKHCEALVCVHQDKHGPAIAIYTASQLDLSSAVVAVAKAAECLPVPFAIPPMLARWDRAIYELRMSWDAEIHGDFPVEPAAEASRWGGPRKKKPVEVSQPQEE